MRLIASFYFFVEMMIQRYVHEYLAKKIDKHYSPQIKNELLQIMAIPLLLVLSKMLNIIL